jgi:hypothetical protein
MSGILWNPHSFPALSMPMLRPSAALGQFLIKSTWCAESGAKQGEARRLVLSMASFETHTTNEKGYPAPVTSCDIP